MKAAFLALLLAPYVATGQSLEVTVKDSRDHPLASALVTLTNATGKTAEGRTGASGRYLFTAVAPGTYSLRAELAGYSDAKAGAFPLNPKESKKVEMTLQPAFFDEPSFVVAGITDTTRLGGHGSDINIRTSEALAKDAAKLRSEEVPAAGEAARHHSLADTAEQQGRPLEAVREYQRAAELSPTEPYLFDWGTELLTHHAPPPAIEVFTNGLRRFPNSTRMLLGLATAYYAKGDYDQAARRFFLAADLDPADATPYLFLGRVQANEIIQLDGYLDRVHRFARLHPDNAWANYYYAVALWKRRNGPEDVRTPSAVRALLEKSISLDSKFAAAYLQLGIVYFDRKDFPKAIEAYRHVIAIDPQLEEAHYRLAQALAQTGDGSEAQKETALYQKLSKDAASQRERERHEIQQFILELRDHSHK